MTRFKGFLAGLVTVLLMSGIAGIPKDYYEAATLDGAGWWQRFRHITVPGVRAEILVSLTLTVIAALKTFDLVYVTTSGGPGSTTTSRCTRPSWAGPVSRR